MLEIIKQFVRRMLMGKGKGILKIPPQKAVDDFANDLLKKFKENGVPDEAVTNPNDVKIIWNQITNREINPITNQLKKQLKRLKPKESADVLDLTGKKIDTSKPILGGKNVPETEAHIKAKIDAMNKKNIKKMKDRKEFSYKENLLKEIDDKIIKDMDMTKKELYAMSDDALDSLRRDADPIRMEEYFSIEPKEPLAYGGVAGLLGERQGYEDGREVYLPPIKDVEIGLGFKPDDEIPFGYLNEDIIKQILKSPKKGLEDLQLSILKKNYDNKSMLEFLLGKDNLGFRFSKQFQIPYASGGLAGMLGERTGYKWGKRAYESREDIPENVLAMLEKDPNFDLESFFLSRFLMQE